VVVDYFNICDCCYTSDTRSNRVIEGLEMGIKKFLAWDMSESRDVCLHAIMQGRKVIKVFVDEKQAKEYMKKTKELLEMPDE